MNSKQIIGKMGEEWAVTYLIEKGYTIIERNFRCRQGEIDIIGKEKEELVFLEIKTRTNKKYGEPAEALNNIKKKHIIRTIEFYLYTNQLTNEQVRVDVIEVYIYNYKRKNYTINHIQNII